MVNFTINKGEKIVNDFGLVFYSGTTIQNIGGGFGAGMIGGMGGVFSSTQIKRSGSVFDSKKCHIYITNKRIILCEAKWNLMMSAEKSIGSMFAEIELKNIKGIIQTTKMLNPAIELSINQGEISKSMIWFAGKDAKKNRDKCFKILVNK